MRSRWKSVIASTGRRIGPVSPLTPATFLIVGLAGIELGEHQKFTAPFLLGASIVMTLDTYGHVMPTLQADAVAKLDQLLRGDPLAGG